MSTGTITANTSSLYAAAQELDHAGLTADQRQAKQWLIEAIEGRHNVSDLMDAWADSDNRTGTYIQALGTALRTIGAI